MNVPLSYKTYFNDTIKRMSSLVLKRRRENFQKDQASYQTMKKVYKFFTTSSTVFAALSLVAVAASAYHFRKIILLHAGIGLAAAVASYCLSWVMRDQARKKEDQVHGIDLLIQEITNIETNPSNYQPIEANFPNLPDQIDRLDVFIANQAYNQVLNQKPKAWEVEAAAKAMNLDQFLIIALNNQQKLT